MSASGGTTGGLTIATFHSDTNQDLSISAKNYGPDAFSVDALDVPEGEAVIVTAKTTHTVDIAGQNYPTTHDSTTEKYFPFEVGYKPCHPGVTGTRWMDNWQGVALNRTASIRLDTAAYYTNCKPDAEGAGGGELYFRTPAITNASGMDGTYTGTLILEVSIK
jgi:hypothetical protein